MNLKSANRAFSRFCGKFCVAIICISLSVTKTEAQSIGHLGVNADPIPLVQAKRPQPKYLARRINRPDPSSKNLLADVGDGGGSVGGKTATANPTTSATVAVVETPKKTQPVNSTPTPKPLPPAPVKPAEPTADDYLAKAADFVIKGNSQAAAENFRTALKLKPDSLDAQLGLADVMFDLKDYAGADAEYQKIIAQHPNSAEARRGRADTLYELKKYDEAAGEYQAAIQAGATDAGVYNNFANALFRTGTRENRDRSIENYRKAIDKQPTWPDAYAGMANALRVQKRLEEARQAVEKSIELAPNSSLAHSVAGRVYADLSDYNRANTEGQKAVQLAPKDAFVHLNLGGILYAQKRYAEAINAYVAAQSYDPQWAVPRNSLGNLFLTANRPNEALDEFQTAARLEPKSSIIHNNLGTSYLLVQKLDAAVANYQMAVQFDERNSSAYYNLGGAYYRQGRYNDSVNAFQNALKLEPNNPQFKTGVAEAMKKAGRGKEAKEMDRGNESSEKGKKKKKG